MNEVRNTCIDLLSAGMLVGLSFLCVGLTSSLSAQNLVPNPSFETYTECPTITNQGGTMVCTPWLGVGGSSDYFNICGDPTHILSVKGTLYDRWENTIFSSGDNPFTWDGRFGQEFVGSGVYVYLVQVRFAGLNGEQDIIFKGDVTVLK